MENEATMTRTLPTDGPDDAMGITNRSSSELNAATDLVGIGGVPATSNIEIGVEFEGKKPDDDESKPDSKIAAEGGGDIDEEHKGQGNDVVPADAKDAVAMGSNHDNVNK